MEIRRPLSEKNFAHRVNYQSTDKPLMKETQRPNSSGSQSKGITAMKSSMQLQKQNQNFYSKYFSNKEQKENIEIKANTEKQGNERNNSSSKLAVKSPKEYQEYKKLQDKLQYLENKIITIKQHIDTSQKTAKTGLTAKFFSQNPKTNNAHSTNHNSNNNHNHAGTHNNHHHNANNNTNNNNNQIRQSMLIQKESEQVKEQINNKPKSSTIVTHQSNSIDFSVVKKPSLSTFVTQVKSGVETATKNENSNRNVLNKPDTAKSSSSNSKQTFKRKASQDYTSAVANHNNESNFLFYVSSVIKGYMTSEITKPIEQIRDHLIQTIQASQFSKNIKPTAQSIIDEKKVNLPPTNRKTIVFDLDETLIHCNESVKVPGDVILPIKFPTGEIIEASINIRPYAQQVLQTLSRHFEIIVFTASHSCYANVVVDYLDPTRQWISHRLFRESCVQSDEGAYLKDLRVLGNRSLSDLVLIDNASYSFSLQQSNGIPILNFYDNKQDQELLYLQNYLMALKGIRDFRAFNQQHLKLERFSQFQDPIELLQLLFKEYIP